MRGERTKREEKIWEGGRHEKEKEGEGKKRTVQGGKETVKVPISKENNRKC